ncbi:MAG: 16S rRNA (guanine(966)-N(2))-methyltransferase RsmD [Lachnospiraceae bacterium]|nr:16S rRNA (guanine(966)-N(2))-methyltransferase RsmD [Lachnospiraceae bacterium]
MRVISGIAKRLQLKTLDGLDTRPTTDRIKETLFNMINHELYDCAFLDLFSGSGAIGIEALSRGACKAVFVELNPRAVICIKDNLNYTKLETNATILAMDAASALRKLDGVQKFDFIFMDPPYGKSLEKQMLEIIAEIDLLEEEGVVIVEAAKGTDFSYLDDWGYIVTKRKEYKTNMHVFLTIEKGNEIC